MTPMNLPLARRASALVISLAFVTILTLLLLAYINVVMTDRIATQNFAQGLKAAEVGRGALDFIIGQMRIEMADGQAPLGVGKYSVFTNVVATNVRPDLVGTNAAVPAMVKMSTNGKGVFDNAGGSPAIFVAVNSSSSNASANGRRITAARWGRVGLGVPSTAPSWFLVGPRGITNAPSPSVEGRFAYAVYDLGSLVDINVAGYPSSVTSTQHRALEGSLAGLDLAGLGLSQAETDSLITGFRNHTSGGSATNYVNHVLNVAGPGGFLTVSPGDDIFLSRQDFLTYAGLRGLGTNVTGNFSTFTRTSLTPAWAPTTNGTPTSIQTVSRANIVAWNPSAGASRTVKTETFDYKDGFANPASINRGPLTQPVTGAFTRLDGTTAQVGEPLVLRRFPLSRLAWLSRSGPSSVAVSRFGTVAAAATRIKQAFGLVWDTTNNLWVYTSPASGNGGGNYTGGNSDGAASTGKAASKIKTLDVVASESREPDFFELLQAGILHGSLGQRSSIANPVTTPLPGEVSSAGHVFQIGANIIDQYDEDDFPTLIRAYMPVVIDNGAHAYDKPTTLGYTTGTSTGAMTPNDFPGIENLPYLMSFRTRAYRPQVNNSSDGTRRFGEAILMPQFWNPHQNAASPSSNRPTTLRIIQTFGEIRLYYMGNKQDILGNWAYAGYGTTPPSAWPSVTPGTPQPMIAFSSASTFAQPGLLDPAVVTATSIPQNLQTALVADTHTYADLNPSGFVGFWLGRAGTTIAEDPMDAALDDTPVDWEVWAVFKLNDANRFNDCPVHQYVKSMTPAVDRNSVALSASDPFWKGDSAFAINNSRYPAFELQYLDGSTWKTYQRFDGVLRGGGADHKWDLLPKPSSIAGCFSSESHGHIYGHIDPRGSRFGLIRMEDPSHMVNNGGKMEWTGDPRSFANVPMDGVIGTTGRPNGEATVNFNGTTLYGNQSGAVFTDTFDPSSDLTRWVSKPVWQWVDNIAGGQRYTDNDQFLRRSDGNSARGVNPLAAAGNSARPVMLNRAFTSVGDIGYVFRDLPFKTLDLFSENSADAGLLDLFCVEEPPATASPAAVPPAFAAGVLNLNGRNANVLEQVLSGAIKQETSSTSLSASEAGNIANAMVASTGTNAMTGLWDLPGFLGGSTYAAAVSGDLRDVKTQMEVVPRRLAAVADARCWNLLIDVIAQTGRYPAGVTNPDKFIVEGERRYWLQVAIDRFTGKIVDQQLEPVFE